MTKEEFFDKIDSIRECLDYEDDYDAMEILDELKDDVNQLLEDEFDAGYNLGLERGGVDEGTSARAYGHGKENE